MSIIVKGMQMPKCCRRCPIPHNTDVVWQYCGALGVSFQNKDSIFENNPTYKHPDCPLVELPEKHGRLIDGDYLYDRLKELGLKDENVFRIIKEEPTVIESEE